MRWLSTRRDRRLHRVRETHREGLQVMELSSPDGLTATYAPRAGMVCCSLRHGGEELLGQRQGLRAYASAGATMGVPLLYPWANRLARRGYSLGHTRVEFPADAPAVRDDGKGLPIHGLLAGCPDWQVRELEASAEATEYFMYALEL